MGVALMIPVAILVAIAAFERGLDPDNFVNPIESSIADLVGTSTILASVELLGLG